MNIFEGIIREQLAKVGPQWVEYAPKVATRAGYYRWLLTQTGAWAPGRTYFIRMDAPVPNPPVKVGFSLKPDERMHSFTIGSPYAYTLIASFPACLLPEKAVHAAFASRRMRGEWFDPDDALSEFIKAVARAGLTKVRAGVTLNAA